MDPKKRDPLLAAVCHDLRAPLAAVTMGASFVLQTTARDEAHARTVKVLEAVLRSCGQMERLIRNFGDLSAVEADAVELRPATGSAKSMLEIAREAVKERAEAKRVEIAIEGDAERTEVVCDHERIVRALAHLLENAVAAAPEGTVVSARVEPRSDRVAFVITDRGPALDPELREHLFDRGWLTRRAGRIGVAFGLAIARGFARAHGGDVVLTSSAGDPTTFTLELPRPPSPQGSPSSTSPSS
ncbi:MAG: HAMP domain-containing histidine kinase [Deltaproteobacteria bacterium]|nr:HAMP domain-containing histidine kinase [Deltaproteobacteria bacterium]